MVAIYQCGICLAKVLENCLQKHHAKVHANINYDIYERLPDVATKVPSINSTAPIPAPILSVKEAERQKIIKSVWGIEPPKDAKSVHVQCDVCQNRMPAESLEIHMKRKHGDSADQVDAIGTMCNGKSLDDVEQSASVVRMDSFVGRIERIQPKFEPNLGVMNTQPPKDSAAFAQFSKSVPHVEEPKVEPFYTIRVSEIQMKQLLDENRVFPKDGFLYLK